MPDIALILHIQDGEKLADSNAVIVDSDKQLLGIQISKRNTEPQLRSSRVLCMGFLSVRGLAPITNET